MRALVFCVVALLASPAFAIEKFALSVYHFNAQYVEGGLIGFPDGESTSTVMNMNDAQVQDAIVKESLDPLLDMYARHPTWGADIEMQGMLLDIIVERHPATLGKMKALAAAGKVSFDSFHWSDQFWLAYPRVDMERSHDLVVKSFAAAGLPLGPSIFTQEGQFAIGMERFFRERGIKNAIVSGGVMGSTISPYSPKAIYTLGKQPDVIAVVTADMQDDLVQMKWQFRDDGERAMTGGKEGGLDPYLGTSFVYAPGPSKEFEDAIIADETAGFQMVSTATYVEKALALGEKPEPLPEVIDAVWHHDVFLWMGNVSIWDNLYPGSTADNTTHTLAMRAHRKLVQVESVVKQLGTHDFDTQIAQAWKDLLMGECSDGTGQNPWLGERRYSQAHSQAALDAANAILADKRVASGLTYTAVAPVLANDPGPFSLVSFPNAARPPRVVWQKRAGATVWEVSVTFDPAPSGASSKDQSRVDIAFPRTADSLIWSGALEDDVVRELPLSGISGTQDGLPDGGTFDEVRIPAANGLVGLGDDTYVIKRTESVHVAAQLPKQEKVVRFMDNTAPTEAVTWKFVVVKGTRAEALAEALAENVNPDPVTALPVVATAAKGCGCGSPAVDVLGLAMLAGWLRRRRARHQRGAATSRSARRAQPSFLQTDS